MKRSSFRLQGGRRLSRLSLFSVAAALAAAWLAGVGLAGAPTERSHENFTDTFPDQICGIDGTSTVKGVDNFSIRGTTFTEHFEVTQVFTATASGKSVVIRVAQRASGPLDPIYVNDNGDGTVTFTFLNTFIGLPEQLRILNGPVLLRDAGVVTIASTFIYTIATDSYAFVSRSVSGQHGPHPDLASDFEAFCNVLIPALT